MILDNEFLFSLLKPALARDEYQLVELFQQEGKGSLRIVIHKKDGITHQDCIAATRIVEDACAEEGIDIRESYMIEVASPGLRRKLRSEHEYYIFKGFKIELSYENDEGVIKKIKGTLKDFDGSKLHIQNIKKKNADEEFLEKERVKKIRLAE